MTDLTGVKASYLLHRQPTSHNASHATIYRLILQDTPPLFPSVNLNSVVLAFSEAGLRMSAHPPVAKRSLSFSSVLPCNQLLPIRPFRSLCLMAKVRKACLYIEDPLSLPLTVPCKAALARAMIPLTPPSSTYVPRLFFTCTITFGFEIFLVTSESSITPLSLFCTFSRL
jgi:hypothetical protein